MSTTVLDPATVAVMAHRFDSVAREMIDTLLRTARSGVLNTARDLSCAILTHDNRLLAFADSIPVHVCAIHLEGAAMTEIHGHDLREGDAYLNNSPYHGGTHHGDHTILVPIFAEGEHLLTVCAKGHQADIGNAAPTTYSATSRDIYEEGAVNLPCVRIQRDWEDVDDIVRMCRMRIRVPDQWYGDYLAGVGAARVGERGLQRFIQRYGVAALKAFIEQWFDYSERSVAAAIANLPTTTVSGESWHDPFPGVPDGVPVRATIAIDADAGRIEVDLTDNVDCVDCGINLSEATTRAATLAGIFSSLGTDVPLNSGSLRRVEIGIREGAAVGAVRHPHSASVATTNLADRLLNLVWRLMAEARGDFGNAEFGLAIPASRSVISGRDGRFGGRPFVNQLMLGTAGGGGTSDCDGWLTNLAPQGLGTAYRDSIEVDEQKYPIIVHRLELMPDSGGAGRYRGAPGTICEFGPSDHAVGLLRAVYSSDGHVTPAQGVRGGGAGGPAAVWRLGHDGSIEELPQVASVELRHGDRIRAVSCGGGGFGPPEEREPEMRETDLREGLVTPAHAPPSHGAPG